MPGHHISLTTFDDLVLLDLGLTDIKTAAASAKTIIGNLTPGGLTNIVDGVRTAVDSLPDANEDVVVLFSDGKHNTPANESVSDLLQEGAIPENTEFYSLGFGTDINSADLIALADSRNGVHISEERLTAGGLSKIFLLAANFSVNSSIVLDPDYTLAQGESADTSFTLNHTDRSLVVAIMWDEFFSDKMQLKLVGPDDECLIPIKQHNDLDTRQGDGYSIVRLSLPYRCLDNQNPVWMHEGKWAASITNTGQNTDTAKLVV